MTLVCRSLAIVVVTASALSTKPTSSLQRRKESLDAGRNPLLSLNLNLGALARSGAAPQAQELFQRISALHKEGYYDVQPDTVSFNSVLKAWRNDPVKALEFWEANHFIRKDIRSYNAFLLSLANAGMYQDACTLLAQMQVVNAAVRPDIVSFNTVLLAHANGGDAVAAEELVEQMVNPANEDDPIVSARNSYRPPHPNAISLSTVMLAWTRHDDAMMGAQKAEEWLYRHGNFDLTPSPHAFAVLLKAYERCGPIVAVPKVIEILQWMEANDEKASTYNGVYHVALAIVGKANGIEAANAIFQRMKEPDVPSYTRLIQLWGQHAKSNQNNPDGANRCLMEILHLFRRMRKDPTLSVNYMSYTTVLNAIAETQQRNSGDIAIAILRKMSNPRVEQYNACIKAVAQSNSMGKVQQAQELLEEMIKIGIDPVAITYNTILKAARTGFGPQHVRVQNFEIGWKAFQTMHDAPYEVSPITYQRCLIMISRQGNSDKALAAEALLKCRDNKCLNEFVIQAARRIFDDEELAAVLGVVMISDVIVE